MIYVVGSICIDIVAERNEFVSGTSNPSDINISLGGVGYNIFRALSCERRFISALGRDSFSDFLSGNLGHADSISLHRADTTSPPVYLAFMESGDLKLAASNLSAVESVLASETILTELSGIVSGDLVVIDANLKSEAVAGIIDGLGGCCRILFEPVSVAKAARHVTSIRDLYLLTPDEAEFSVLIGRSKGGDPSSDVSDRGVIDYMQHRNIENILVTRGKRGLSLFRCEGRRVRIDYQPERRIEVSDTTGAGDVLVAAVADGLHEGGELPDVIPHAMSRVESYLSLRVLGERA